MNPSNNPHARSSHTVGQPFLSLLAEHREPAAQRGTAGPRLGEFGARLRLEIERLAWCVSGEADTFREPVLRDGAEALRSLQSAATALELPLVASYCDSLRQIIVLLFHEQLELTPKLSLGLLACLDGLERCAASGARSETAAAGMALVEPLHRVQSLLQTEFVPREEPAELTADELLAEITEAFVEESVSRLRLLPTDLASRKAPDAPLRRALGTVSTIRLAAEMFGFGNLHRFATGVEEAAAALTGGRFEITPRVATALHRALDTMADRIEVIAALPPSDELCQRETSALHELWGAVNESVVEVDDGRALCGASEGREQLQPLIERFVEESQQLIGEAVSHLQASAESGELPVRAIYDSIHAVGGMAGSLGFAPARRYASALEEFLVRVDAEGGSQSAVYELRLCLHLLEEHVVLARQLPPSLPVVPEEEELLRDLYATLDWQPPRSGEQSLWHRLSGGLRFGDRRALVAWMADLRQIARKGSQGSAGAVRDALRRVDTLLGPPGNEFAHSRPLQSLN